MKKTPSIGFIFLVSVFIGFGIFISWVAQVGWYDRINTPHQTKSDLAHWAGYLEEIANGYTNSKKTIEILVESAQLRSKINQPKKALRVLEKALTLDPENKVLKAQRLPLYWKSGQRIKAIKLAKENLATGQKDAVTISVLLESLAEKSDTDLAINVVQAILEADLPEKQIFGDGQIIALGLTADKWTYDGKPGFLVVSESKVHLKILSAPGPQYTPLTVTIEDQYGARIFSHVFKSPGYFELELPNIPVGENKLFVIKTDKFWIPQKNDNRKLGVNIKPISPK